MPTPNLALTPHQMPPEVLDLIMSHTSDSDLPCLVRVNSSFYLAAKPLLFRRIHLSSALELIGPNHPLGDRDAGNSFGSLETPRPLFRDAWLRRTHILRLDYHYADKPKPGDDPLAGYRRGGPHRELPPLPGLRVFHSPFMLHEFCAAYVCGGAFDEEYQCLFLDLPFKTLVHYDVTLHNAQVYFLAPPAMHEMPAGFRVEKHVLVFNTNFPEFHDCAALCYSNFSGEGRRTILSDDIILLFPVVDFETSVPDRVASHGDPEDMITWLYGMSWALVDILYWILSKSSSSVMVVGGSLDNHSVFDETTYPNIDNWEGPFGDIFIHHVDEFEEAFRVYIADHVAVDDERIVSLSGAEKLPAIKKTVEEYMSRLSFTSLADIRASGELDDVFSPAEWDRISQDDNMGY